MFTSISTQTHEEFEDAKRLACLCGEWEPVKGECLPIERVDQGLDQVLVVLAVGPDAMKATDFKWFHPPFL